MFFPRPSDPLLSLRRFLLFDGSLRFTRGTDAATGVMYGLMDEGSVCVENEGRGVDNEGRGVDNEGRGVDNEGTGVDGRDKV